MILSIHMSDHVSFQAVFLVESAITNFTHMWPISRVNPMMNCKFRWPVK